MEDKSGKKNTGGMISAEWKKRSGQGSSGFGDAGQKEQMIKEFKVEKKVRAFAFSIGEAVANIDGVDAVECPGAELLVSDKKIMGELSVKVFVCIDISKIDGSEDVDKSVDCIDTVKRSYRQNKR